MSELHTNIPQPAKLAINKRDVAELVDVLANEVMRRIDQRETSRMIANAVRDGVAKHMEAQRTAKAEPEIDAATYLNNLQEGK